MSHLAKTYERILEARLRKKVEPQPGEEQYGYRKSRSTTDLMFALRMVVEKSLEYNKTIHIIFIDLAKAFDSIPRKNYLKY
jgi:hypothetical protein